MAQRYAAVYGYNERAMAKLVVDTRVNANHTDGAIWKDKPLTVSDVLASPVIADPLHMLEIVMPCVGGAAVVVAKLESRDRHPEHDLRRPGFGHMRLGYPRAVQVSAVHQQGLGLVHTHILAYPPTPGPSGSWLPHAGTVTILTTV